MKEFMSRHKFLTFLLILLVIGFFVNLGKNATPQHTYSGSNNIASGVTETKKSTVSETSKPTPTPVKETKLSLYEESKPLKTFLFSIKSWPKLSRDDVEKTCKEMGLLYSDQMGWGGTSWSSIVKDPNNYYNQISITFARPKDENGKEHFAFMDFYATRNFVKDKYGFALRYNGEWHAKAVHGIKEGFFVDDVEFSDLQTAYDALIEKASQ